MWPGLGLEDCCQLCTKGALSRPKALIGAAFSVVRFNRKWKSGRPVVCPKSRLEASDTSTGSRLEASITSHKTKRCNRLVGGQVK